MEAEIQAQVEGQECGELKDKIMKVLRSSAHPKIVTHHLGHLLAPKRPISIDPESVQAIYPEETASNILIINIIMKGAIVKVRVLDGEPCLTYEHIPKY